MFNPQLWIAIALAFVTWGGVMFGTGWHYGAKNTVPQSKYDTVVKQLATDQAALNQAREDHDRDAKTLAAKSDATKPDFTVKDKEIADGQKHQAELAKKLMVADANLATARLMLGDATADTQRAVGAAAAARSQGAAQSTDLAGRLGSCQQAYGGLVTSARVNNAELKRAILRRDTCVVLYENVEHTLNGG